MPSPSAIVAKIRQEAALFDSKDRLLNFATKNDFQSPLVMEAGDLFYEKWLQSKGSLPLESFFQVSANFTAQQKITAMGTIGSALREKADDFDETDLYLVLGFLKWDGNALAPSLLVPLEVDAAQKNVFLSKRPPIENIILRERLKDSISLPKAEDAFIDGKFSLLLYFSLFEKAIASERNWKFTRHGICLAFFDSRQLLIKKRMEAGFNEKKVNSNPVLTSLFREEGFEIQESLFEEQDFDKVFSPADHHFLYITDSHTNKVTIDAANEKSCAYAIQALPGTGKMKVVANIVADAVAKQKKVMVAYKRSISKRSFQEAWKPSYVSFPDADHNALEQEIRKTRKEFTNYYDTVNKPLEPSGVLLRDLLCEFTGAKPPKRKLPESVYQGLTDLKYADYQELKEDLQSLTDLYFNHNGIAARLAFQGVKVPSLTPEHQQQLAGELSHAAKLATALEPVIHQMEVAGLFPTGIFLSSLADILELIQQNFGQETPEFEDWQLRSNNWQPYKETLMNLPEAGDQWVRYRRQTSDIYTENAVDENIMAAREDFVESQKATLKGLSDRYRSSRRKLMSVLRHPKEVQSDAKLIDLIDTLLELQANKRIYKECAVLGNHLLGRDWHYEGSNWVELKRKIQYLYSFREKHQNDPKLDLLLNILEQWHLFKEFQPQLATLTQSVRDLQQTIRQINKNMDLDAPLESLSIEKWLGKIKSWNKNWDSLDVHLQLTSIFAKMAAYPCKNLIQFLQNPDNADKDILETVIYYWVGAQIQAASQACPDLFTQNPKVRAQKSKAYRQLLDQFCGANFNQLRATVETTPESLTLVKLCDSFRLSDKQNFDLAIILDADGISIVEALPTLLASQKTILVGDPYHPFIEYQRNDAYQEPTLPRSPIFQESILTAALRQGVPTRELWFSSLYKDASIVNFANHHFYGNGIKQLPQPHCSPFKGIRFNTVSDKVSAVAKAALLHAEKHPEKTLGIVAFHQSTCQEIEGAIQARLQATSPAANFFNRINPDIRCFVKTPDRAIDNFRDVIIVCAEAEGAGSIAGDHKVALCSTLAKSELQVFISESDISKRSKQKQSLFWEWIDYLQAKDYTSNENCTAADSPLRSPVIEALQKENIQVQEHYSRGFIPVGPVIVDQNNAKRYLALIEDDCTTERFRDSVEDRDYVRPQILRQLGWKVLNLWLPFWFTAQQDEVGHLVATIAIEQSVAPPPAAEISDDEEDFESEDLIPATVPYVVQHPKIEGTPHDKPIAELPTAALITQLKFYVDSESPIHEKVLLQRVLELHHVDRAGPMLQNALTEAIHQGLQKKRFIKTGPFFYSLKSKELHPRNRSQRPDFERDLAFVAPEERALMPVTLDEHTLKQAMGLLE